MMDIRVWCTACGQLPEERQRPPPLLRIHRLDRHQILASLGSPGDPRFWVLVGHGACSIHWLNIMLQTGNRLGRNMRIWGPRAWVFSGYLKPGFLLKSANTPPWEGVHAA